MISTQLPTSNSQLPPQLGIGGCGLELRRHVSATRADIQATVAHVHSNRMPAAVLVAGAGISEVVLFAQLVGDARGGRFETVKAADDLGAATGVVGDLPQCVGIDPVAG